MTTPAHITMLREISAAGNRERTGALDVDWDGAHASLFFLFGHPSHIVFESEDGRKLVGDVALTTLVAELPDDCHVAPWRRAMVTEDTLTLTAEELMELFAADHPPAPAELAAVPEEGALTPEDIDAGAVTSPESGSASDQAPESDGEVMAGGAEAAEAVAGVAESNDAVIGETAAEPQQPAVAGDEPATPATSGPGTGIADLPLLPLGRLLFSDAMANVVNLESVIPRLPDCLLVLSGAEREGAAVVTGGRIIDAVWVTAAGTMTGTDATAAVLASTDGHILAHRLDDPRLGMALPVLWRGEREAAGKPDAAVAQVRRSRRTCALVVAAEDPGVALFHEGELVAVYTADHRWPSTTVLALRTLLHSPGAQISVAAIDPEATTAAPVETAEPETADPQTADPADVATPDEPEPDLEAAPITAAEPSQVHDVQAAGGESEPGGTDEVSAEPQPDGSAVESDLDTTTPSADAEYAEAPAAAPPTAAEREFVPPRLEIDFDALRTDLTGVAVEWLGEDDAADVIEVIAGARPAVDDFVDAIAAIRTMEMPGHDAAVMRAMAREMHYRAAEVLCGV